MLSYKGTWRLFEIYDGEFELNYFSGETRRDEYGELKVWGWSATDNDSTSWNINWFKQERSKGYLGKVPLLDILYDVKEFENEK